MNSDFCDYGSPRDCIRKAGDKLGEIVTERSKLIKRLKELDLLENKIIEQFTNNTIIPSKGKLAEWGLCEENVLVNKNHPSILIGEGCLNFACSKYDCPKMEGDDICYFSDNRRLRVSKCDGGLKVYYQSVNIRDMSWSTIWGQIYTKRTSDSK